MSALVNYVKELKYYLTTFKPFKLHFIGTQACPPVALLHSQGHFLM